MPNRKLLIVAVSLVASFVVSASGARAQVYNAYSEFSLIQGGASGVWTYQEYDGSTFADLVPKPDGVGFATGYPTWARETLELPVLFKDGGRPEGLIFHPGVPANGPQPSRHDIVLRWTAPSSGYWDVSGSVRGDTYFGNLGGNGFQFTVSRGPSQLVAIDVAFDDKTSHPITLTGVPVSAGESLTFQIYDNGNNEYDNGFLNVTVSLIGPDDDGDGVPNPYDNCPTQANTDQADLDADGVGDICDPFPSDPDNEQAQCEADLSAIQADADGDGVRDLGDHCPDTASADPVDSVGCSKPQFCGAISAQSSMGRRTCRRADWNNDEPLMTSRQRDCTIDRGASGLADDVCAPMP